MKQFNVKIIGLTGGIATGKSTVANIIKKHGYKVIDADKISKQAVEIGKPAYKKIVKSFGKDILNQDKSLNRKKLADLIFGDTNLREKLNSIVHPFIFRDIKKAIEEYSRNEEYLFLDIPLLIEEIDEFNKHEIDIDEIWLVYTDEKTQLDRLVKRDNISEEQGIERIKSQIPMDLKKEYATRVIDNRGSIKSLIEQVEKMFSV